MAHDLNAAQWRLIHQASSRAARSQGIEKTPGQYAREQARFLVSLRWRLRESKILADVALLPDSLLVLLADFCEVSRHDVEEDAADADLP